MSGERDSFRLQTVSHLYISCRIPALTHPDPISSCTPTMAKYLVQYKMNWPLWPRVWEKVPVGGALATQQVVQAEFKHERLSCAR